MKIFCLKDNKVGAFLTPMFLDHKVQAIRSIQSMLSKDDNMLSRHPADFELFEVGDFDASTGEVVPGLVFVINVIDIRDNMEAHNG